MSQPRYQIFVSSTFKDLKDERSAVLNAILKLNQFPAGMENFPAANDTAWELIKMIIEVSDYYVLIIGGKYGSMDENGISYTEKEYDFARAQGIHILAFTHAKPGKIEVDKTEQKPAIRKKLEAFKTKVGSNHHWSYWENADDLREKVITSLSQAIVMYPQRGWVKSSGIEKNKLLERLADLQKRYDDLIIENQKLKDSTILFNSEQFSFGSEKVEITFSIRGDILTAATTWQDIFFELGDLLISKCVDGEVKTKLSGITSNLFFDSGNYEGLINTYQKPILWHEFKISDESFKIIQNQLLALNLINVSAITHQIEPLQSIILDQKEMRTIIEWTWELTEKGRKLYLSQKAIRQEQTD